MFSKSHARQGTDDRPEIERVSSTQRVEAIVSCSGNRTPFLNDFFKSPLLAKHIWSICATLNYRVLHHNRGGGGELMAPSACSMNRGQALRKMSSLASDENPNECGLPNNHFYGSKNTPCYRTSCGPCRKCFTSWWWCTAYHKVVNQVASFHLITPSCLFLPYKDIGHHVKYFRFINSKPREFNARDQATRENVCLTQ